MPVDDNPYAEYAVYPDDQPLRPTQTRNDSLRDMVYPQGPISPVTQPPPKDFQGVHQTPPMASHAYASLPTQTPSPRGQPTAATPKISLTRSESQGTSKSIETNDSGAPIIPSHPSHIPMPPIPDHDRVHFHSASRSSSHGRKEEKSNEKLDALRPPTGLHRYTDRSPPALTRTNSPAWPTDVHHAKYAHLPGAHETDTHLQFAAGDFDAVSLAIFLNCRCVITPRPRRPFLVGGLD